MNFTLTPTVAKNRIQQVSLSEKDGDALVEKIAGFKGNSANLTGDITSAHRVAVAALLPGWTVKTRVVGGLSIRRNG